jgi:hypothetical protein
MSKIKVSDLEFDDIKQNLKEFLSSQSEFSDYNFEGAGLSILLDVLAYATHYNALYDNLIVNESFLDSATKRSSVVSRASELGYTPKSATCSKTVVDITFSSASSSEPLPNTIQLPTLSPFTASGPNGTFTFYNRDIVNLIKQPDSSYKATGVTLYAGKPQKIAVSVSDPQLPILIPNANADKGLITVKVFENNTTSVYESFAPSDNIVTVDSSSKVYWVKEIDNGAFSIKFGDGVLGKSLSPGNLVIINYFISYGVASNGIADNKRLVYTGSTTLEHTAGSVTFGTTEVLTKIVSFNGSEVEDIESIKFNAPRAFTTQNRAVTTEDFKHIVLSSFADAESVSVWGGEDNIPPVYGKVFIAVSQHTNKPLSISQKSEIESILRTKKALTIIPVVVDAEYLNLELDITVYYDPINTTLNPNSISSIVNTAVQNYNDLNLKSFDKVFRESRLLRDIDVSNQAIVNSSMSVVMRVDISPRLNVESLYQINVINPIQPNSIITNGFYVPEYENLMYIQDDGAGKLQVYYYDETSNKIYLSDTFGTVDYDSGVIQIQNLEITSLFGTDEYLVVKMTPKNKNVVSALTKIVKIDRVNITVIADKTASGNLRAGFNFQF